MRPDAPSGGAAATGARLCSAYSLTHCALLVIHHSVVPLLFAGQVREQLDVDAWVAMLEAGEWMEDRAERRLLLWPNVWNVTIYMLCIIYI